MKTGVLVVVGTWVNSDYDKLMKYGKLIIKTDFTIDAFDDPTRTVVPGTYTFIIDDTGQMPRETCTIRLPLKDRDMGASPMSYGNLIVQQKSWNLWQSHLLLNTRKR